MQPGETATLDIDGTAVTSNLTGRFLSLHSRGGIKALCQDLGIEDGDRLTLIVVGPGTLTALHRPPAADDLTAAQQIGDLLVARHPINDPLSAIAHAIGFDGDLDVDFNTTEVLERLTRRTRGERPGRPNRRLLELLLTVQPDLGD